MAQNSINLTTNYLACGLPPDWQTLHLCLSPSLSSIVRSFTSLFQPEKRLKPAPNNFQSFKNIIFYNYINLLLVLIPVSWALHFAAPEQYTAIFIISFIAIVPLAQLLCYGWVFDLERKGCGVLIFLVKVPTSFTWIFFLLNFKFDFFIPLVYPNRTGESWSRSTFVVVWPVFWPKSNLLLLLIISKLTEEIALRVGQTLGGLLNATLGNAVELIVAIIALFKVSQLVLETWSSFDLTHRSSFLLFYLHALSEVWISDRSDELDWFRHL